MQVRKMETVAFKGMDVNSIMVEARVANGLPKFVIVGLPDAIVSESRVRISSSLGSALPAKSIIVNLSPAYVKKTGSHYDLPIALCLLVELKLLPEDVLDKFIGFGELTLDGKILPCKGALSACMFAAKAKKGFICSKDAADIHNITDIEVLAVGSLDELIAYFKTGLKIEHTQMDSSDSFMPKKEQVLDFNQVKGQESAKLALEIAGAGGHHVLMVGSPGTGKSMLAKRFTSILPDLSPELALDVTLLQNLIDSHTNRIIKRPPFRSPHHSSSVPALIGGGSVINPGEISLAHGGVLFLDEFPEFSRQALQALREAMETREIHISRAQDKITYPANFQLIAAMNPCKCGMFGKGKCIAGQRCSRQYWERVSGPLLDRFDLCVTMQNIDPYKLLDMRIAGLSSAEIRAKLAVCKQLQLDRQGKLNAELKNEELNKYCFLSPPLQKFLQEMVKKYDLSARGIVKVLKVARTLADLENNDSILKEDLLQAVSFRFLWDFQ